MLHLLILRYLGTLQETEPHVSGHVRFLERHHAEGVFLASGQTIPAELGGAILARGVSRRRIEDIASEDPFVVAGVAAYEIATITPGRAHPALIELLTQDAPHGR